MIYRVLAQGDDDEGGGGSSYADGSVEVCNEYSAPDLSVSTNPAKVVAGAGSQLSVVASASGGSGAGYNYVWAIISTQPGDNLAVATISQGPNCSGQSTCTATLQGVVGGKATLQVLVTDSQSNQASAQTRLIIVQFTSVNILATNSIGGPAAPTTTSSSSSTQPLPFGALLWPASLWTIPTPAVLIQDLPSVTVVVTSTLAANDPDVQISFDSMRATLDSVNGNTSAPNPNFSYQAIQNASGAIGYTLATTTGTWSVTSPQNAAIRLKSQVNLLGGGHDGLPPPGDDCDRVSADRARLPGNLADYLEPSGLRRAPIGDNHDSHHSIYSIGRNIRRLHGSSGRRAGVYSVPKAPVAMRLDLRSGNRGRG